MQMNLQKFSNKSDRPLSSAEHASKMGRISWSQSITVVDWATYTNATQ